jgi:hypothetical protein
MISYITPTKAVLSVRSPDDARCCKAPSLTGTGLSWCLGGPSFSATGSCRRSLEPHHYVSQPNHHLPAFRIPKLAGPLPLLHIDSSSDLLNLLPRSPELGLPLHDGRIPNQPLKSWLAHIWKLSVRHCCPALPRDLPGQGRFDRLRCGTRGSSLVRLC